MVVNYRPPPSATNVSILSMFLNEFRQFLESLVTTHEPLFFNLWRLESVDALEDRPAQRFSDLLDTFNLVQHVKNETQRNGHTLDLIITRSDEASLVSNVHITDPVISDHFAVHCGLAKKGPIFLARKSAIGKSIRLTERTSEKSSETRH